MTMNRRRFVQAAGVAGLGLLVGCGQLPGQSQPAKVHRVGVLSAETAAASASGLNEFRQALRELGYIQGTNLAIEVRWSGGQPERLPDLAAELVRLPLDVLVAYGDAPVRQAKEASSTIPIVIGFSADPVGQGHVASLARPGGNVTGLSVLSGALSGKRLELLRDTALSPSRIGFLLEPASLGASLALSETEAVARTAGVELIALELRSADDLTSAFDAASAEGVGALLVAGSGLTASYRGRIVDLAARHRLPAMYTQRDDAQAGGLMSHGPNRLGIYRRSAYYVDRILKGAKPADIPVEQPREFDFVINLKTAQALGLTIPQHVLLQATEVIQ
jgi:putative tryptophan/tyrosine transport system substrate-binding protein